jgi:hypothetical protein
MDIFTSKIDGKYRYLYKITNILTNQYYYGIHSTKKLDDGYMGSGRKIKEAIKQHGVNNFIKEYIEFFNDDESLKEAERKLVNAKLLSDPMCYNIAPGGGEFKGTYPSRNIYTGEIKAIPHDENYDKSQWAHITSGRKQIHKIINGICINKFIYKEYVQKYLDEGWILGNNHSVIEGKIKINNGKKVKYIKEENIQKYLDEGWIRGGLSIACKGNIRVINSDRTKEKLIKPWLLQKYLDEGWIRGSLHTGRIHIHNELGDHKMIFKNELQKYLDEGWIKGSNDKSKVGKIKIIKNNKCLMIDPIKLQKYLDEGWIKGAQATTQGKIVVNKNGKRKFIEISELQKYLDEGWIKGVK